MTRPKRFYKDVRVEDGQLLLDGKPVKLRGGTILTHPSRALMASVAEEWAAREKDIHYGEMPLTRLLMASLALDDAARELLIAHMLDYTGTDLLCYRAPDDELLAAKQAAGWNPWLEWLREKHGVLLRSTSGIIPVEQNEEAYSRLRNKLEERSAETLVALNELTALLGSLVLALAVGEGVLAAEEGFALSILDDTHQAERWGVDEEQRHAEEAKCEEVRSVGRFLTLLRA